MAATEAAGLNTQLHSPNPALQGLKVLLHRSLPHLNIRQNVLISRLSALGAEVVVGALPTDAPLQVGV